MARLTFRGYARIAPKESTFYATIFIPAKASPLNRETLPRFPLFLSKSESDIHFARCNGGVPRFSQSNFHQRLIFVYTLRLACKPSRASLSGKDREWLVQAFSIFFEPCYYFRLDNAPLHLSLSLSFMLFFYRFRRNHIHRFPSRFFFFIVSLKMIYSRKVNRMGLKQL